MRSSNMTVSNMVADAHNSLASDGGHALVASTVTNGTVDLKQVPIRVIRPECRHFLSTQLNRKKIILTEEGLPRDWRGILHCINLKYTMASDFMADKNPFGSVFERWMQEQSKASLDDFQEILRRIDRWDVLDDTRKDFGRFRSSS